MPLHSSWVHGLPSAVHAVPLGSFVSAGHEVLVPVHVSATSHSPAESRHTTVDGAGAHVPTLPGTLHAWQSFGAPPPHASSQQTPSTQTPLAHWVAALQVEPSGLGDTQTPVSQISPDTHSESRVQPPQMLPLQFADGHWMVWGGGQSASLPVQFAPWVAIGGVPGAQLAERHEVEAAANRSVGHVVELPLQVSATSQPPAAGRQTVVDPASESAGQLVELPEHVSATSQGPAATRHVVPALPAGCWQAADEPSHSSSLQGLVSAVHTVPLGFFVSAGQLVAVPLHVSGRSHSPVVSRQIVPAFPAGYWQSFELPLH